MFHYQIYVNKISHVTFLIIFREKSLATLAFRIKIIAELGQKSWANIMEGGIRGIKRRGGFGRVSSNGNWDQRQIGELCKTRWRCTRRWCWLEEQNDDEGEEYTRYDRCAFCRFLSPSIVCSYSHLLSVNTYRSPPHPPITLQYNIHHLCHSHFLAWRNWRTILKLITTCALEQALLIG